jgi:hypothetical protein
VGGRWVSVTIKFIGVLLAVFTVPYFSGGMWRCANAAVGIEVTVGCSGIARVVGGGGLSFFGGCFVEEYKKNRNRIIRNFTNCEGFRLLPDSTSILFQENGIISYDDIKIAMVLDKWRGDSFYSEGYKVIAPNKSRLPNADLYYTVLEDTVYFFDTIDRINYVYINSPNEKLYINQLTSDTVKFVLEEDRVVLIYENNNRVSIIDYNNSGLIRSFTGFDDKLVYRYSRSRLSGPKIKRINEQLVFKGLRQNYPEFISIFLAVNILNSNRYYDNLIFTGY